MAPIKSRWRRIWPSAPWQIHVVSRDFGTVYCTTSILFFLLTRLSLVSTPLQTISQKKRKKWIFAGRNIFTKRTMHNIRLRFPQQSIILSGKLQNLRYLRNFMPQWIISFSTSSSRNLHRYSGSVEVDRRSFRPVHLSSSYSVSLYIFDRFHRSISTSPIDRPCIYLYLWHHHGPQPPHHAPVYGMIRTNHRRYSSQYCTPHDPVRTCMPWHAGKACSIMYANDEGC
jgi:hypothetical protein